MAAVTQAFVLGAGLGTRLRPLTEETPKPLVPIFQKRLITFALDHLIANGVERFAINTHHQPRAYSEHFPGNSYRDRPIQFHHEPVLLETAGGIWNARRSLQEDVFLVYNGDILTDLPLAPLIEEHVRQKNLVTLALRSRQEPKHVAFDKTSGLVIDIRNRLGTGAPDDFLFTGLYVVDPAFIARIPPGEKCSVIPIFLEMIQAGARLGAVVIDEGHWWDVGTPEAYLELHRELPRLPFPRFAACPEEWRALLHPSAEIHPTATVRGSSVIGEKARVEAGAIIEDTIVWPGAQIASRSRLGACIVRSFKRAQGDLQKAIV